jgi:hypothetical protein
VATRRKPKCRVCEHLERTTIERRLGMGQSLRSIRRRYHGVSRLDIVRHRDLCMKGV